MRAILIIDHGSRVAAANAQLAEVAALVESSLGDGTIVRHAHMELAAPTIPDALAALVAAGAQEIAVHPYFLAPGRHATEDIPRIVAEGAARHPGVAVRVTPPLGVHPLLAELVILRARPAD